MPSYTHIHTHCLCVSTRTNVYIVEDIKQISSNLIIYNLLYFKILDKIFNLLPVKLTSSYVFSMWSKPSTESVFIRLKRRFPVYQIRNLKSFYEIRKL